MYTKESLVLGIDGGGTKTRLIIADINGHVMGDIITSGVDFVQIGQDGIKSLITEKVQEMLKPIDRTIHEIASVCIGIPRIGESPAWDRECPELMQTIFPESKIYCFNDVQVGLYGSLCLEPGIHLISGTGSIAMGMNRDGLTHRSGGWNEHFSDEGSGYKLGLKTWEIFSKQIDGRLPKTILFDLMLKKTGLDNPVECIAYFETSLTSKRDEIATYQLLLEQAARAGDGASISAYREAAVEFSEMVMAVFRALVWDIPVKLSYSGGVFKCGDLILRPLKNYLDSQPIIMQPPRLQPAQGAILYAICAGNTNDWLRENVIANLSN